MPARKMGEMGAARNKKKKVGGKYLPPNESRVAKSKMAVK